MDQKRWSINEVLDFAIAREIEASQFYSDLAARMDAPAMKKVFEEFAKEEMGHKTKLEAVKRGEYLFGAGAGPAKGLGLAEYLVEGEPSPEMSYPEALILAMKKEKAAYKLYLDLSAMAGDGSLKDLFLSLAGEEAKHKLRFEIEYDDKILREN